MAAQGTVKKTLYSLNCRRGQVTAVYVVNVASVVWCVWARARLVKAVF
jgi:hypothetical protein